MGVLGPAKSWCPNKIRVKPSVQCSSSNKSTPYRMDLGNGITSERMSYRTDTQCPVPPPTCPPHAPATQCLIHLSHRKSKRNKSRLFDLITGLRLPFTFPLLFLPGMEVGASGNINSAMKEGFKNTSPSIFNKI